MQKKKLQRTSYIFFDSPLTGEAILAPNQSIDKSQNAEKKLVLSPARKHLKKKATEFDLNMSLLIEAQRNLTNCPEGFNLSSTIGFQRKFIQQGTIWRKNFKNKFGPIRLILTNDLLVLAKPQSLSTTFQFRWCYNLRNLKLFDLPDDPKAHYSCFRLISLSTTTPEKHTTVTLGSTKISDKSLWFDLIKQQVDSLQNSENGKD